MCVCLSMFVFVCEIKRDCFFYETGLTMFVFVCMFVFELEIRICIVVFLHKTMVCSTTKIEQCPLEGPGFILFGCLSLKGHL